MSRSGGPSDDKTQIISTKLNVPDNDRTVASGVGGLPNAQRSSVGGPPKGTVIGQGLPPNKPAASGGGRPPPPPPQAGETLFVPSAASVPGSTEATNKTFNPVVGWLVVVKGPDRGDCKPLFYGPNSIGRGERHTVRLDGDQRVSRNVHAYIIYDDFQRKFFIRDNDANPVRYKGQLIGSQTELHDRDEVIIGDSTLMFIALCNSGFDWVASGNATGKENTNAGTEPSKS